MNRVDRLVAIVLRLQGRRVVRAEELAAHFEISVRTVYRDVAALCEAGVPVVAEPGVGYSLVKGYHLPPVTFTAEEASALSIGGMLVERLTDNSLRKQMATPISRSNSTSKPKERRLKSPDIGLSVGWFKVHESADTYRRRVLLERGRSSDHRTERAIERASCINERQT
jgi:predicted DNA-binding transcriptional regulator YafY